MKELFWTPEASDDRELIYTFIEADSPSAALALDELFSERAAYLVRHPGIGKPGQIPGTREWVVHPRYVLVYDVVQTHVRVLRLLHTARAPVDRA
ncbi:type II toxin-antitoxin system mRNA interferase toxin, RelE/StbE family [Stenotrophomonas sp. ESTM1D_MKCIP4_1]|uniref:type II toxin-antitoxin system RelE/ParE family toxin n=1 Tax=Stenotrophomonas sp. ESTM1D_MKCIP4_1 TaxID=2072414 RepID=UPI000D53D779|nr:type II toxin-antitoxin system RelE/ParE family toxin [Stenotrophomonas sp. ESTM1D_MKCIP4_1]AWH53247.1 type II toxin-antitoxin system mRNA interferase toxin, RelE/StbE family [Stenotrophomonas sp. ESTM1D_MKCIP4_1]